MPEDNNQENMDLKEVFESHLKEILDFGPEKQPIQKENSTTHSLNSLPAPEAKSYRSIIELLVRIIAGFAVVGLLILFALHIAYKL
jgi:hypothetical protein